MSEEILKALMQLFALVVKQDGGTPADEREYVNNFLKSRLSKETAAQYLDLFDQHTGPLTNSEYHDHPAFPSVKDSLRILGVCESIALTLTQEQRVTVLIWLYEMVNAGQEFTPQRINILNTVSEVFRITSEEFSAIEQFIKDDDSPMKNRSIVSLDFTDGSFRQTEKILESRHGTYLKILRIESIDHYFIRYFSDEQILLDGTPENSGPVYPLGRVSSVKVQRGPSICFSEISAFFQDELHRPVITLTAQNISLKIRNESLNNISFNAREGRVTGIVESDVNGGSLLLSILSGNAEPDSGSLKVNGSGLNESSGDSGITALITRSDLLLDELTVSENVHYAARKNISGMSDEELIALTLNTLLDTGFSELKDHKAESLDFLERKKLNMAMGLVTDPQIICIDDPTDGLSPHQIPRMMDFLRNLACKGKLIFTLVRKPSSVSFGMLDEVLVLDGGYLVFSGKPVDAVGYFKTAAMRHYAEPSDCSCGCINPEPIFSILDLRVTDESGNLTRQRKVMPEEWAALFNSLHPFIPMREDGEKLSARYTKPPNGYQKRIALQLELRRNLSRLKKFLRRSS